MIKSILKEITIIILLCISIILVLGVVFYDSIPSNKIVPNKLEAYVTPENIKSEIEEKPFENSKIEVTYEITESDLKLYKQTHSYVSGKPDPFDASTNIDKPTEDGGNNNNGNSTSNSDTSHFPNRVGK